MDDAELFGWGVDGWGGWAFDHPVGVIADGDGAFAGSVGERLRMS